MPSLTRRSALLGIGALASLRGASIAFGAEKPVDPATPLPSWNDGPARQAILDFVRATTDAASPTFVAPQERIATFDQDGTLWVEHPIYTQLVYCFDRVPGVVKANPALADVEPFKTVLTGDRAAIAKLPMRRSHQDRRRHAHRHGRRRVPRSGRRLDLRRPRSALGTALYRSRLSAADRAAPVSARQRLQDLYRDGRRPGLRARLFGADLRHTARAGRRVTPAASLIDTTRTDGRSSSRSRSSSLTTTTRASPKASTSRSAAGRISRSAIRAATGRCWNIPRPATARGSP